MVLVAWILVALFPVSEVALAMLKRSTPTASSVQDRGSMGVLWSVISIVVVAAIILRSVAAARMHLPTSLRLSLVLCLLGGGLALRWAAILTLGRLFTVDVAVQRGHALLDTGLYRYVRHPSYTGLLLAFAGLGVFFVNWLSLAILLVPIGLALVNRMRIEEAALHQAFGPAYAEYCARTKRLVPGVY